MYRCTPSHPQYPRSKTVTVFFCFVFVFKEISILIFYFLIYLLLAVLCLRFCARAFSSCGKWGSLFIAVRGPLTIAAPRVAEHRLQTRRLSNCGSQAQPLRGMWDLPRPGLEPVSPALAGGFSTTAPPGKPQGFFFNNSTNGLYKFSRTWYSVTSDSDLFVAESGFSTSSFSYSRRSYIIPFRFVHIYATSCLFFNSF